MIFVKLIKNIWLQASFLLRQDVSRGDKVVVFSIFNEDDAPKFRNVQENTKFGKNLIFLFI